MSYDHLRDRLAEFDRDESDSNRIVSLPDGSIDRRYAVDGDDGARIDTPAELGRQLESNRETFPLTPVDTRPGGQATNAAQQIHALGEDATLVGYLDHPIFEALEFETYSMGTPAVINVFAFDDSEVLLPEPGPTDDWSIDALDTVIDWERVVGADALCCVNWVSVRGQTDVFDRLRTNPPSPSSPATLPIVVDPGALGIPDDGAVSDFFETLSETDAVDSLAVVLNVNPQEFDRTAAVLGIDADGSGESVRERLAAVRTELGVTAVVVHGSEAAHAATADDAVTVPMVEIDDPSDTTGAGDRFSGALACALARGWAWETALALGNACAAHFVETAATPTPDQLRTFLENRAESRSGGEIRD
ncbi:PfkB family carbohydrate kinase [Natrialba sp. SSL1]|uniref:PfkB family carbohydrate kinase n=1 Tax=Natrialba sp. SSL1 TaxID=1869245 RepID=UPI0008F8D7CB|nr:PfkB family carbohydrate kinase [Natrialba sp. SSL1]OIB56349.1 carbohydrate kinase [Natrialba sp. SSL1]